MRGRIRSDDMVFMTYDYVNGPVYSSHQEKKKRIYAHLFAQTVHVPRKRVQESLRTMPRR